MENRTVYIAASVSGLNHKGVNEICVQSLNEAGEQKQTCLTHLHVDGKDLLLPENDLSHLYGNACFIKGEISGDGQVILETSSGLRRLSVRPAYIVESEEEARRTLLLEKTAFSDTLAYADLADKMREIAARHGLPGFEPDRETLEKGEDAFESHFEYGVMEKYNEALEEACLEVLQESILSRNEQNI